MKERKSAERLTYEANCNEMRGEALSAVADTSMAVALGSTIARNDKLFVISGIISVACNIGAILSGKIANRKDAKSDALSQGHIDTDLIFQANIFTRNHYRSPSTSASI